MLITPSSIQALQNGFNTKFREGLDTADVFYDRIAMTVESASAIETYGWMQRIPKMREWVGPRQYNNLTSEAYNLVNKTFEDTVAIPVDDIEDDRLGGYSPIFEELGRVAKKLPDQQLKTVMQGGKVGNQWDGVPFFSASHPLNPAGNQSNLFTGSALNATNYDTVRAAMTSYTANDGEPLGVMPKLIAVPPQLQTEALEIVAAERNSAGATNVLRGTAEVLVIPELANEATTWYLLDTSRAVKPFVWQNRMSPRIDQMTQPTDEGVFSENIFRMGVKARGAAGYGLWWFAARCEA